MRCAALWRTCRAMGEVEMTSRRTCAVLLVSAGLVFLAASARPAHAAGTWTHLGNFTGTVGSVHAIGFDTVVVGGSYTPPDAGPAVFPVGRIYRSENGGTSFSGASMTTSFMVTDVEFADATNGWATGSGFDAESYRTTDGGRSWAPMGAFARKATKKALSFSSASNGWAVGQQGIVERTIDGGTTWTLMVEPVAGPDANAVDFVDANNGWVAGGIVGSGGGFIKRTTDGGQTWTTQKSGLSNWLNGIAFIDTLHGVAVGSGGTLLVTEDGGATWKQAKVPRTSALGGSFLGDLYGVAWAGRGLVLAAGASGLLAASTDLGKTWTPQTHPNNGTYVWRIRMTSKTDGWILGENWRIGQTPPAKPYFSMLQTTDGGATWVAHKDSPADLMRELAFPSATVGYAVGYRDWNFKTTDGGVNWTRMTSLKGIGRAMGVAFTSVNNGVIAGDRVADATSAGVIAHTADGGATWSMPPLPTASQLRHAAARGSSIWVVGLKGTILRSGDGGASWGTQKSGTDKDLMCVQAVGADQIVAVGSGGTILVGSRPTTTVSKPKLGFTAKPKQFLQITGTVKPAVAGSKTKVVVYRKVGGKWKTHATIRATNFINVTSKGERYSRYYANGKAGAAGEYSAIATFEHPDYKTSKSARFSFKVK